MLIPPSPPPSYTIFKLGTTSIIIIATGILSLFVLCSYAEVGGQDFYIYHEKKKRKKRKDNNRETRRESIREWRQEEINNVNMTTTSINITNNNDNNNNDELYEDNINNSSKTKYTDTSNPYWTGEYDVPDPNTYNNSTSPHHLNDNYSFITNTTSSIYGGASGYATAPSHSPKKSSSPFYPTPLGVNDLDLSRSHQVHIYYLSICLFKLS